MEAMEMNPVVNDVYCFMQNHKEFLKWDEIRFMPFICCMALEEWCREHDEDVVEKSAEIANTIANVNAELGRYE